MPDRTCTVDGCLGAHRARGLCSTHYNQQVPPEQRHRKVMVACTYCGDLTLKIVNNNRRRYCDFTCRDLHALAVHHGDPCAAARAASQIASASRPRRVVVVPTESLVPWGVCDECGAAIVRRGARRYCKPCSTVVIRRRRALRSAQVSKRRRLRILERDRWVCWLCGGPIDPALSVPHRLAGTVDHLVPRSLDGSNTEDNLGAAHMHCNSARGNRIAVTSVAIPQGVGENPVAA